MVSVVPTANSTLKRGRKLSPETRGRCHFDDSLLVGSTDRSAFETGKLDWNWSVESGNKNPRIPYFFHRSVKKLDKQMINGAMSIISDRTCIIFKRKSEKNLPAHHLEISIENETETCEYNGGGVGIVDGSGGKVIMSFDYSFRCNEAWELNLVLHEFGHVLGLIHTHIRPDREEFVHVNNDCIAESFWPQFDPLKWNEVKTCNVPYKCKSMMHYGISDVSKYPGCYTFLGVQGKCGDGIGGKEPIKEDWDLINRIHCIVCAGPECC